MSDNVRQMTFRSALSVPRQKSAGPRAGGAPEPQPPAAAGAPAGPAVGRLTKITPHCQPAAAGTTGYQPAQTSQTSGLTRV